MRRTKIEQTVALIFKNLINEFYAISISLRSTNFYYNQFLTVAKQSNLKKFFVFKNFIITNNTRKSKSKNSKNNNNLYKKNNELSIDTNSAQFHVLRLNNFNNKILLRQLNNDIKTNVNQRVKKRISYYFYENFESRNSKLKKINLNLQVFSKISF